MSKQGALDSVSANTPFGLGDADYLASVFVHEAKHVLTNSANEKPPYTDQIRFLSAICNGTLISMDELSQVSDGIKGGIVRGSVLWPPDWIVTTEMDYHVMTSN